MFSGFSQNSAHDRYTAKDLAGIILDFYKFLTTLHYKEADLKIPPPGGWPDFPPACYSELKSPKVIELMKHMLYFSHAWTAIHYKSGLIDYLSMNPKWFTELDWREEDEEFIDSEGDPFDPRDVLFLAWGHESGGRDLVLDVRGGEIIEISIRMDTKDGEDINSYLENLKDEFRSFKLIPRTGCITYEAHDVEETEEEITEDDVAAQESEFGTDLDWQYVRQVYRQHGWPDAFRQEEAEAAIDRLEERIFDTRGGWETDDPYSD
ncbi:hypothetical protein B0I35DRAFT_261759 [Stachybotrys elegans]|uniref:Uncharacterized protein n=1 Tax=Stachybotrys elegans TaxID=80388 RepID=A0A8K0ST64_9HYPO|nr:hypothetical protein B0I35DRAFT_261759 [Stachybotrys elegans]